MKNSRIIIESSLTYVALLCLQKSYPFIKLFFFKIMVIEMLSNNDIQFYFCSNDFTLSKENKCNYVHYCFLKKNSNHFI